jgi:hypothetical protein
MNDAGKTGCGCLLFFLVIVLVAIGLSLHPISLRFVANQLRYEDKIFPSDVIFVPWVPEDRQGETYSAAFKELKAGNGKAIWIEDETILGTSILEPIQKMAKNQGIKDDLVKSFQLRGTPGGKPYRLSDQFSGHHIKKVIIVVPEYASRVYHAAMGPLEGEDRTVFLIRPVKVSYFSKEAWWKDAVSRSLVLREFSTLGGVYIDRFKFGDSRK